MKKTIAAGFSLLILIGIGFYFYLYPRFEIISGYNAKILCSCLFVSNISEEVATEIDLGFGPLHLASNEIDYQLKMVSSNVWGMHPKKAIYREGLGCALVHEEYPQTVAAQKLDLTQIDYRTSIWPESEVRAKGALADALNKAFDKPGETILNTRAVLVIKGGEIIGEAYGEDINAKSKLLGWSMMKSVNAAIVGLLAQDGHWNLDDPAPVRSWENDERKNITLRHLLNMTSGLDWEEDYSKVSTATSMLYASDDMGRYAMSRPLANTPGEKWYYSSGTSNLLATLVADAFPSKEAYWEYTYTRLFGPLGMKDFIAETDASGTFVGSSYGYGSARDWAKFALLFLNEGQWFGTQILDSAWVDFCRSTVTPSNGYYGGQFWTNGNGRFKSYSTSDYWLDGFQGQQVSIHPQHDLIIVRLGVMYDEKDFDFDQWVGEIIEAARQITSVAPETEPITP